MLPHWSHSAGAAADPFSQATLVVRSAKGGVSGGTVDSMRTQMQVMAADPAKARIVSDPYSLSPDRGAEADLGPQRDVGPPRYDRSLGLWVAPFFMAPYNTRIVRRSNALLGHAYGRRMRYSEVMGFSSPITGPFLATGLAAGTVAGAAAMAFGPTRKVLDRVMPSPGEGPDEATRRNGHFKIEVHGTTAGGRRVISTVAAQGDPGYAATAVMLGQSALALALGGTSLPDASGVLTPATGIGQVLVDRLVALARELSERARAARGGDPDHERLVRCVRALRCDGRSFADDGPRNADRLARELARSGRRDEQAEQLLETASRWSGAGVPPFLDDLRALRRRLLLDLLPPDRTEDTIPRVRTDVLELLSEVRDHLEQRQNTSRDAADEATWRFLSALEGEPEAVKRAVISYTSVFAATCQQSARQELATLKGSEGYDTVVVDEAARAMPLDLFIPMARAKRRIVLVGDHRQLPHILDQELERELEEALSGAKSAGERTSEMLKESLFERLFKDLGDREKRDGIPRVVTLDEQYRMHPVLGQFVSDQFYKPYGEAFRSPRPASEFVHSLPGHSGPASWLSVPRKLGPERDGQSKSRPVEAEAIVAELKRLMDSREGRELTFGVISFYKQQVKAIEDALVDAGIVARTDDATEIVEPYRELLLPNGRVVERLRFGTVDAFQGMEFDVVFLSMVRSNPRGIFGHVTSPNRLCVAMSRQKRLLIVAGDDGMLRAANAPKAISPLVEFHKLSEVRDAARV